MYILLPQEEEKRSLSRSEKGECERSHSPLPAEIRNPLVLQKLKNSEQSKTAEMTMVLKAATATFLPYTHRSISTLYIQP